MPSELLHIPPLYTLVGLYRLITDPLIRTPVLDKIRHATIRGLLAGGLYAFGSWKIMNWFVRKFLVGEGWFTTKKIGEAVKESVGGKVRVGLGSISVDVDLILCLFDPYLLIHRYTFTITLASDIEYPQILHLQESSFGKIQSLCFNSII
jgi:hypothetical protein